MMKVRTRTLVSNTDMLKNYKDCREKAEKFGKVFVLKNNHPDAVLFSISEYERLAPVIEALDETPLEEIRRRLKC